MGNHVDHRHENDFLHTRACSNRFVAITIQVTFSCQIIRQKSPIVSLLGPWAMMYWFPVLKLCKNEKYSLKIYVTFPNKKRSSRGSINFVTPHKNTVVLKHAKTVIAELCKNPGFDRQVSDTNLNVRLEISNHEPDSWRQHRETMTSARREQQVCAASSVMTSRQETYVYVTCVDIIAGDASAVCDPAVAKHHAVPVDCKQGVTWAIPRNSDLPFTLPLLLIKILRKDTKYTWASRRRTENREGEGMGVQLHGVRKERETTSISVPAPSQTKSIWWSCFPSSCCVIKYSCAKSFWDSRTNVVLVLDWVKFNSETKSGNC